jgi:hypothetical protein
MFNMNILANCRKYYPANRKDPAQKTLTNLQGYVPDPKWTEFLSDWAALVDSSSLEEYTTRLGQFRKHQKEAVDYVIKVWLTYRISEPVGYANR